MTDIRRTLLWVVFTMSLVLIWDAWQKHTGQGSMFGGPQGKPAASAGGAQPNAASAPGVPAPVAAAVLAVAGAAPALPGVPTVAPPTSERVTITTDVVKATFDSQGGNLVQLELLDYRDAVDAKRNVVLLDQSASRLLI